MPVLPVCVGLMAGLGLPGFASHGSSLHLGDAMAAISGNSWIWQAPSFHFAMQLLMNNVEKYSASAGFAPKAFVIRCNTQSTTLLKGICHGF